MPTLRRVAGKKNVQLLGSENTAFALVVDVAETVKDNFPDGVKVAGDAIAALVELRKFLAINGPPIKPKAAAFPPDAKK